MREAPKVQTFHCRSKKGPGPCAGGSSLPGDLPGGRPMTRGATGRVSLGLDQNDVVLFLVVKGLGLELDRATDELLQLGQVLRLLVEQAIDHFL